MGFSVKCKRGGGLGKLFRTLGSKKGTSPKHKSSKHHHHHSFTLRLHDRCKSSSQGTVQISEPLQGEEERLKLVRMLRDGSLTVEEAMNRTLNHLSSRSQTCEGSKKGSHKPASIFYLDSLCYSSYGQDFFNAPNHGSEDPPPMDPHRTLPSRMRPSNGPSRKSFTNEEFTKAILARTQVKLGQKLASSEGTNSSSEPCHGECGNIMCSLSTTPVSQDLSPPPQDGASREGGTGQRMPQPEAQPGSHPTQASAADTARFPGREDGSQPGRQDQPTHQDEPDPLLEQGEMDSARHATAAGQQTQRPDSPTSDRRSHHGPKSSVLGKIKSLTNRSSYSTSEEGHSSDCEDADETCSEEPCSNPGRDLRGRSSFAVKVRDLHRDVKRRFSKLRTGSHSRTVSDDEPRDQGDFPDVGSEELQTASSVESLPGGSGGSRTSQSNRSSSSAGEDEGNCNSVIGPILGRARALVDVTPSPYDRDALGFKKGDHIDIIAKNKTGTWVGVLNGKVGHFKFINVQEITDSSRSSYTRRSRGRTRQSGCSSGINCPSSDSSVTDGSGLPRPQSLEQLLQESGLQECVNVLMLHGYENLEAFREITREDLISLGITDPTVQGLLLRAADLLGDEEAEEYPEDWVESAPKQSQCLTPVDDPPPINDLDAQATTEPHAPHHVKTIDSQQHYLHHSSDSQDSKICLSDEFQPNIPASQADDDGPEGFLNNNKTAIIEDSTVSLLKTTAQILKNSGYDSEGSSVSYPAWRDNYHQQSFSENGLGQNHVKVPPPIPKRTTPPTVRPSKLVNGLGVNGSCGIYFAPEDLIPDNTVGKSTTMPRKKVHDGLQQSQSNSRGSEKKLYKRFTQRKNSLQTATSNSKFPRPPSLSLLTAVCRKLENEGIDLGQDPYTDKTGFCGIPPALVQRYGEELQRDVYDVAEAMDQARINSLQLRGRRGVPNDFLADSCNGPVVEANYRSVREWLVSLGLPMYEEDFSNAGYQDLSRIANMRDTDLCAVGIRNARHVRLLTTAIGALNIHFGRLMCP